MLLSGDFPAFERRFMDKLGEMLSPDQLGAFILVLANSMQDEVLHQALSSRLYDIFLELCTRRESGRLMGSPDDLAVFDELAQRGMTGYRCWQHRQVGHWHCSWNPLRSLRPARSSSESFSGLRRPFEEQAFHFDKPFLKPEIFGEEHFGNTAIRTLYQKFPFIAYHLLILPDASAHRPQWLEPAMHALAWELAESVALRIPGFGAAFNSLGAGASVNHLHFHGFVQPGVFAVERVDWRHHGGDKAYPLPVARYVDVKEAWRAIDALHAENQPYNLLYRPGVCYVVQRAPQSERTLPEWMETAGWQEVCGGFSLSDRTMFDSLTAHDIEQGLALLRP